VKHFLPTTKRVFFLKFEPDPLLADRSFDLVCGLVDWRLVLPVESDECACMSHGTASTPDVVSHLVIKDF
jgi:hypothetical protein